MSSPEELRITDAAVVARYLQLRSHFHDQLLAAVEEKLCAGYDVQPTRRIPATLAALVRNGYYRPCEGEIWPVVFLTPVNITLALCIQLSAERLAEPRYGRQRSAADPPPPLGGLVGLGDNARRHPSAHLQRDASRARGTHPRLVQHQPGMAGAQRPDGSQAQGYDLTKEPHAKPPRRKEKVQGLRSLLCSLGVFAWVFLLPSSRREVESPWSPTHFNSFASHYAVHCFRQVLLCQGRSPR